jgi:TetR/AcrR family transcriptional repressor of nem operon
MSHMSRSPVTRPRQRTRPATRPDRPAQPSTRLRDAAKDETRRALIAAGLVEFAEHGLDLPSLDAICSRAGYTRGAFYVHFRDREDFLVAVMEYVIGTFLDAVIATGDEAHDLEHTIERFAEAAGAARAARRDDAASPRESGMLPFALGFAFHRLLEGVWRSADLRARFVHLVREGTARVAAATRHGQKAGTIRRDVDAEDVAFALAALALGVITAIETGVPFDVARVRTAVQRLLRA